jgi:hypothetical protein
MNADQEPTEEQRRLGNRCRAHTEMVIGMIGCNDVDGAMAYLRDVEESDGKQMVANVFNLMIVKGNALLHPDML